MSLNNFVREYLHFTRKERIAIGMLLIVLFLVFLTPLFRGWLAPISTPQSDTSWLRDMARLELDEPMDETKKVPTGENSGSFRVTPQVAHVSAEPFYFNPNTISATDCEKLGIPLKTAATIKKYLAKGGRFNRADDLQKIYGMRPSDCARLAPFVQFNPKPADKTKIPEVWTDSRKKTDWNGRRPSYHVIDINLADTTAFIALPGIGSKLAIRIVNFRDKLGGFNSVEQVGETYGLRDSVFQQIRQYLTMEPGVLKKININKVSKDELKLHPYVSWQAANAIIAYRDQHGPFTDLDDLKKIQALDQSILTKLLKYLSL